MVIGREKLFPNQEKGEIVFLLIRKHWFNYIIFLLLDLLMILPITLLLVFFNLNPDLIDPNIISFLIAILSAFVFFILAIQLYGFVDYYLDVYIVTDQRIVDIGQDGFFKRQISELHLHQVQDVNANVTGIWGTLLRFGDVNIQTAAERENFVFKSIPHPYNVAKQILDLHEDHIEKLSRSAKIKKYQGAGRIGSDEDSGLPYAQAESRHNGASLLESIDESVKKNNITKKTPKILVDSKAPEIIKKPENTEKPVTKEAEEGELKEGREIDL